MYQKKRVLIKNMKALLQQVKGRITLIIDIGSTKNMKYAFLGVCAAFIEESTAKPKVLGLALKLLHGTHDNEMIDQTVRLVMAENDIDYSDVVAVVTDGASNMKKAFR